MLEQLAIALTQTFEFDQNEPLLEPGTMESTILASFAMQKQQVVVAENIPSRQVIIVDLKKRFRAAKTFDEKIQIIQEMEDQIGLLSPINHLDDTFWHFIVKHGDLETIYTVLEELSIDEIDRPDFFGETPLIAMVKARNYLKCNLLIQKGGANPFFRTTRGCSAYDHARILRFDIHFAKKTPEQYIAAKDALKTAVEKGIFIETIDDLISEGFTLDEYYDEDHNTILHWLVRVAPFHVIEQVLWKYYHRNLNLNVINLKGETPFFEAAGCGRQRVMDLLKDYGVSEDIVDNNGNAPTIFTNCYSPALRFAKRLNHKSTVFIDLVFEIMQDELFPTMMNKEKTKFIFETVIHFACKNNWLYAGVIKKEGDDYFLTDCEDPLGLNVNCFDMAHLLAHLLREFNIPSVSTYRYENITSIPFTPQSPKIKGTFRCFDSSAHNQVYKDKNHFSFKYHCVVKVGGQFFDPTFCCYYDDAQDILAPASPSIDPQGCYYNDAQDILAPASPYIDPQVGESLKTTQQTSNRAKL